MAQDAGDGAERGGRAAFGAGWVELAGALLATLALVLVAGSLDRRLGAPPSPDLVGVGAVADPHHVHIDAIYGSFAREAAEGGGLRVHNHQTGEPHPPTLARPWDFAVGKVAAVVGAESPLGILRVDRLFAQLLFPLGCVLLLGELLRSRAIRLGALVALVGGGSLYWIEPLRAHAGSWLDSIGGLSGLGFAYPALLVGVPHLALEVAAFAASLGAALRARRTGGGRWIVLTAASLFLLASVRPYSTPAALVGVASAGMVAPGAGAAGRRVVTVGLACLPAVALLLHDYAVLKGDTVFSALDVVHPAPPFQEQLLFFGAPVMLLPLALLPAVRRGLRAAPLASAARLACASALLVLLAIVEGPFVDWPVEAMLPLPLFAVLGAARVLDGWAAASPRAASVAGALVLALHLAPSAAYAAEVGGRLEDPRSGLWILADEAAALERLSSLAGGAGLTADEPPVVLLCEPTFGRLVPWLAGVRVYAGHADHTVDFAAKSARARGFFRHGAGAAALAEAGVTHVLFAPRTRAGAPEPETLPGLERVFASGEVRLYRVSP